MPGPKRGFTTPHTCTTVDCMARNQPSERDRKVHEKLQGKVSDFQVTFDDNVYLMVLSGHIAALHTKLAHLDKQIKIHCIYPHPQSDTVKLNAPDYDPDIDREPNFINAVQPSNADSVKEETITGTTEPENHTTIRSTTNRSEHQPSEA